MYFPLTHLLNFSQASQSYTISLPKTMNRKFCAKYHPKQRRLAFHIALEKRRTAIKSYTPYCTKLINKLYEFKSWKDGHFRHFSIIRNRIKLIDDNKKYVHSDLYSARPKNRKFEKSRLKTCYSGIQSNPHRGDDLLHLSLCKATHCMKCTIKLCRYSSKRRLASKARRS